MYANFHKGVSNEEVVEIFTNEELYVDDARLAAFRTLKERNYSFSSEQLQVAEKLEQEERNVEKEKLEHKQINEQAVEAPLWYSPAAIIGFSLFFSTLLGCVLLGINFFKSGKKNKILYIVIACVVLFIVETMVIQMTQLNFVAIMLTRAIGGFFLIEFFWKRELGSTTAFTKRPIWIPLAITLLVSMGLFYMNIDQYSELFNQLQHKG